MLGGKGAYHCFHGGLDVRKETFFQLVHVAAKHVTRGGFFFQHARSDRDALVPDGDHLDFVVLVVVPGAVVDVGDLHVRFQPRRFQQTRHHHG